MSASAMLLESKIPCSSEMQKNTTSFKNVLQLVGQCTGQGLLKQQQLQQVTEYMETCFQRNYKK